MLLLRFGLVFALSRLCFEIEIAEVAVSGEVALERALGARDHFAGPGVIGPVDGRGAVQMIRRAAELNGVIERHALPRADEAALPVLISEIGHDADHRPVELAIGRVPLALIDMVHGQSRLQSGTEQ